MQGGPKGMSLSEVTGGLLSDDSPDYSYSLPFPYDEDEETDSEQDERYGEYSSEDEDAEMCIKILGPGEKFTGMRCYRSVAGPGFLFCRVCMRRRHFEENVRSLLEEKGISIQEATNYVFGMDNMVKPAKKSNIPCNEVF